MTYVRKVPCARVVKTCPYIKRGSIQFYETCAQGTMVTKVLGAVAVARYGQNIRAVYPAAKIAQNHVFF